jgi:RNA polymerase sigma-70 factor (ECF subfamily)
MADPVSAQRFEKLVLPHMNSAFNVARRLTHNGRCRVCGWNTGR